MFNVSSNYIITATRGDSFTLNTFINLGTKLDPVPYFLEEGDKVYFGLMEPNRPFEHALIRKVFTIDDVNEEGQVVMNFSGEMTEHLLPGTYYYMIKLVRPGKESGEEDQIDTIISKTKFVILD